MSSPNRGRSGTTPGGKGRFDGYDVMAQRPHWDKQTAHVVAERLAASEGTAARAEGGEGLEFFSPAEAPTVGALLDMVLAQHQEPKVPVLAMLDARLAQGSTDGWRYQDMPEDAEAWHYSLKYLDEDADEEYACRFHQCSTDQQGALLQAVQDAETWHGWPAKHVWSLWSRYACAAFYAHPWAWNEIGFGGPAYPRGYKVLRPGWREPWERAERDAEDPVPWADRAEQAKREHKARLEHP